eukprot:scaffold7368_cov143-Isochrysis_galbana.AAC.4
MARAHTKTLLGYQPVTVKHKCMHTVCANAASSLAGFVCALSAVYSCVYSCCCWLLAIANSLLTVVRSCGCAGSVVAVAAPRQTADKDATDVTRTRTWT